MYVFGDNAIRRGLGGQAREMRGEPNAIGVMTKWNPSMNPDAFLSDDDKIGAARARVKIGEAFLLIEAQLAMGYDVVIPAAGLGTGLAKLPSRAPQIYAFIEEHIADLEKRYGRVDP